MPGTLLPKILIGVLVIAIFFQLQSSPSASVVQPGNVESVLSGLEDGSQPPTWFQDAKPADEVKDDSNDTPPPRLKADPTPSADTTTAFRDYEKTFVSYGATQCLPDFDKAMKAAVEERTQSCSKHTPFSTQETRRTAFATITTGDTEDAYQRAILSQMFASAVHGTSTHVLCEQLSDGAWNKIAFLLNLVMNEMLKPAQERLEWIMWIDRDAIVLDPCRPLSSFLPPNTTDYEDVNLITNNDGWGLNAGVFIFKVNDWATDLFNTILAYRYFRPDDELILAEQTAMETIISEEKWKKNVVRVPWYWFNAYPDEDDSVNRYRQGLEPEDLEWYRARMGDYVVHFAGDDGRSGAGRMPDWLDMLQEVGNIYETNEPNREVTLEVKEYWDNWLNKSLTDWQITGEGWSTKKKIVRLEKELD